MSLSQKLLLAARLPAPVVIRRGVGAVERKLRAYAERAADRRAATYANDPIAANPIPLGDGFDTVAFRSISGFAVPLADLHRGGFFDLLGSGWVAVRHGMACAGVEGSVYPPTAAVTADRSGTWLAGRINSANLGIAQSVWRLTDDGYAPIDWHIDFKSGYRWREDTWHGDIAHGHVPGADIKVPWELARMQHLALFAAAYAASNDVIYAHAARNQILDFIAQNPPRFGVNWRCAMDVAIRAANWAMAWSLFRALGFSFDRAFEDVLGKSLLDHGRHVVRHLEWYPEGRGNHYLADVAGLAFIAAILPSAPETDAWLAFATQEVQAEILHQFYPDGGNFEASVPYHRLSLEMGVFALALLAGLPEDRRRALTDADPAALKSRPKRPLRPPVHPPGDEIVSRVARAAQFLRDLTKPGGRMAQIGDNDSGRFFKIHPVFDNKSAAGLRARYANLDRWREPPGLTDVPDENTLDSRPTVAGAAALLGRSDLAEWAGGPWLDSLVVASLSRRREYPCRAAGPASIFRSDAAMVAEDGLTVEIAVPGGRLREDLISAAYPDFGAFLFRSRRLFLAVRCGPIGQNGRGGHAHNDQLAIELTIDGEDWIADPGSYLYTTDRKWRNAYRSVTAHAAPRMEEKEPGRLDLGDFWLGDEAKARCLSFSDGQFVGEHRGFGLVVKREVTVGDDTIVIRDRIPGRTPFYIRLKDRDAVRNHFRSPVPLSPGYGRRFR
jgi:hypothetical protein